MSTTVTDFHSHILPCIDDGSASVEESAEMLRSEYSQGIKRVVATPHFYPQYNTPSAFLQKRALSAELLEKHISGNQPLPEIILGAEVYFFRGISESEEIKGLTIGEKKYILIEMPLPPWSDSMYKELEAIYTKQGLFPVIAHVDRYIAPFRTFGIPEKLEDLPVYVQANASFFIRKTTQRMALRMLKQDKIHLLGSDCHNMETRLPNLGEALEVIRNRLGEEAISRINSYEREILD